MPEMCIGLGPEPFLHDECGARTAVAIYAGRRRQAQEAGPTLVDSVAAFALIVLNFVALIAGR